MLGYAVVVVTVPVCINFLDEKVQSLENELKNANDLLEAARQRG